jgi:hypothetical protein
MYGSFSSPLSELGYDTYTLEARDFGNFHEMVNKALVLENCRGIMERKRKQECQGLSTNKSWPRVSMPSTRPIQGAPQQSPRVQFQQRPQTAMQSYQTPQRQFIQCPNATPGSQNVQCKKSFRGQCRTLRMEEATIMMREGTSLVIVRSHATAPTRGLPPPQPPIRMAAPLLWQPGRTMFTAGSTM